MKTNEKDSIKSIEKVNIDSTNFFEINGDIYIKIQEENNKTQLLKYNEKFNKLVVLQFMENCNMNTEDKIIEILSTQYIESLIYKNKNRRDLLFLYNRKTKKKVEIMLI